MKNHGNWPGTMKNHENSSRTMQNQPGTMKNHGNWPGTLKYHPWTLNNHKNPPGTIKNRPGTLKNHKTWPRTMKKHKNRARTMKNQPGWLQETPRRKWWFFVTDRHLIIIYISSPRPPSPLQSLDFPENTLCLSLSALCHRLIYMKISSTSLEILVFPQWASFSSV